MVKKISSRSCWPTRLFKLDYFWIEKSEKINSICKLDQKLEHAVS